MATFLKTPGFALPDSGDVFSKMLARLSRSCCVFFSLRTSGDLVGPKWALLNRILQKRSLR